MKTKFSETERREDGHCFTYGGKCELELTIEQLQAELEQHRWIPVSERLPEDVFPCLITNGQDSVVTYYAGLRGAWIADHYDVLKLKQHGRITHWKPITLPPKAKQ